MYHDLGLTFMSAMNFTFMNVYKVFFNPFQIYLILSFSLSDIESAICLEKISHKNCETETVI